MCVSGGYIDIYSVFTLTKVLIWKRKRKWKENRKTTKGMNIDNTRFREFLLNIEFCKATVIYRTCTMPTILKLHFYQCLKSIVTNTCIIAKIPLVISC